MIQASNKARSIGEDSTLGQMRRCWQKTRPCRKCSNPLLPGTFYGRHTMCKGCLHAETKAWRQRRKMNTVLKMRPTTCRTCPNSIEPCSELYIPKRQICKQCKHNYESISSQQRRIRRSSLAAKWSVSEAYAARSLELALAMNPLLRSHRRSIDKYLALYDNQRS